MPKLRFYCRDCAYHDGRSCWRPEDGPEQIEADNLGNCGYGIAADDPDVRYLKCDICTSVGIQTVADEESELTKCTSCHAPMRMVTKAELFETLQ